MRDHIKNEYENVLLCLDPRQTHTNDERDAKTELCVNKTKYF